MVVLLGFEPRQTEPKPVVLPLHHKTILVLKRYKTPKSATKIAQDFVITREILFYFAIIKK